MTFTEDDIIDGLLLQAELLNPFFGVYQMATDPSWENFAKMMYIPGIISLGTAAVYFSPLNPAANRIGLRYAAMGVNAEARKQMNRMAFNAARVAIRAAPYLAPVAAAAAGAYVYEKKVNEPIRKSHGGSSRGTWFGPFASGFGTVV